jgi:hypothetical protein
MSVLCQKRMRALHQTTSLLNHLVGARKQCWWHFEAERPRCVLRLNTEFDPPYYRRVKLERFGLLTLSRRVEHRCELRGP